ncbi:polysaccharide export protein EpsE [Hymenobacter taeanensis]|uniref:Polysaccharide export protein EpsE n=1 Tax=Hymenobacter taeanensis TaxID=2735321 RepID=A0A6M6BE20_9BACT|nr:MULTISPECIES: polysaccharide biosynthesis/export family protein [Hymenobacter]QJX46219.1 polysaccharide export protein EpsE [Hymenobacter taeanensis]UOQ80074.1 polysaccharide biosynthesis/export family protein [Hymenobacter sp. 5414T-23]
MQKDTFSRLLRLCVLCVCAALLSFSCTTSKLRQQNILFRTTGAGALDTARLRDVVNRAERNYIIQPNDYLYVQVATNKGERIIDPNGELGFGSPGGINGGGANRQPLGRSGSAGGRNNQQQQQGSGQSEFLVQHDGMIRLPMIEPLRIAGYTLLEADSVLQLRYSVYYKDVFVQTRVNNNRVVVMGAVAGGPGQVIPLYNDNMNLLEVLASAGGISGGYVGTTSASGQSGRADNIRLIRGNLKNPQVQIINLTTIDGMRRASLQVEPNDIIYVEPIRRPVYETLSDAQPYFGLLGTLVGVFTTFLLVRNAIISK